MHKHVCMYMCVLALLCFVHLSGGQITGRVYEAKMCDHLLVEFVWDVASCIYQ